MARLTTSQVKPFRNLTLKTQGGLCKICGTPCSELDAVLDHDHTTGIVRGVLHRGCNSMLGKIENHRRIAKLNDGLSLHRFLSGVCKYIAESQNTDYDEGAILYPTHRTAEEKRERINKRARIKRTAAKGTV